MYVELDTTEVENKTGISLPVSPEARLSRDHPGWEIACTLIRESGLTDDDFFRALMWRRFDRSHRDHPRCDDCGCAELDQCEPSGRILIECAECGGTTEVES